MALIIYSVKQDGALVAPTASFASADGNNGDWHDAKGYSVAGWSGTPSFYHVVNYTNLSIGIGQNPNAGLAYGDTFHFRLVVKYMPASGEAVSVTIDVTYKIHKDVADSEVDAAPSCSARLQGRYGRHQSAGLL